MAQYRMLELLERDCTLYRRKLISIQRGIQFGYQEYFGLVAYVPSFLLFRSAP
jgi:hypothetical protein